MSRSTRERYERHHDEGGRYGFTFGGEERLLLLRAALAGSRRVLDLGCRDGTLAQRLGLDPAGVVGLDIDGVALGRARREKGLSVVQADLWAGLPVRSRSVDAVLAGEFLEHCPDPWSVAREVARVLVPGGVFVGSVPNATRLKNRIRFATGRPVEIDRTHLHSFSPSSLVSCLGEAGFDVSVRFCESRFIRIWPSLVANTMVFRAHLLSAAG